jgi:hypothetical protein
MSSPGLGAQRRNDYRSSVGSPSSLFEHNVGHDALVDSGAVDGCGEERIIGQASRLSMVRGQEIEKIGRYLVEQVAI